MKISRRDALKGIATAGATASFGAHAASSPPPPNQIVQENSKPGTTDWQLTYTRVDPDTRYRCPWIEGYASHASVRAGDELALMVSTNPPGRFVIDIYRMGYYGGMGGRHMLHLGPFDGVIQPDPPIGEERMRECAWTPCTTVKIPALWMSGVYLGKLSLLDDRYQSYVVFIVRDERRADLLFQCSDNTWQAYNRWPDNYALYDDGKSEWALKPGVRVSYDRPYGKYCQILDAPLSQGSGEFLLWEFPFAYWLEREGYDVTYCSNTDTHANPTGLLRAKGFLSVGHDEYWSLQQFDHVKAAVGKGVNVGFFSGNTCCFVAPFFDSTAGAPNRILTRAGPLRRTHTRGSENNGPIPDRRPERKHTHRCAHDHALQRFRRLDRNRPLVVDL